MVSDNIAADAEPIEIELKDPSLAALLAWLWPGAGHIYHFGNVFFWAHNWRRTRRVCVVQKRRSSVALSVSGGGRTSGTAGARPNYSHARVGERSGAIQWFHGAPTGLQTK